MITRERLNELVKQGATIYVECWGNVKELNLNDLLKCTFADKFEEM